MSSDDQYLLTHSQQQTSSPSWVAAKFLDLVQSHLLLLHNQRDKKPKLGNLHRDRLNIHPINTVLNQKQLTRIVHLVIAKICVNFC